MIPTELINYSQEELVHWLRHEAGSSNPDYFHAVKTGGLKLQQVPEEYAQLLLLLKERSIKTYLELGIGNGGSFAMACYFLQATLDKAVAVDDFSYKSLISQSGTEVSRMIEQVQVNADVSFINATTDRFFAGLNKAHKFDCIFIDADHSYEAAHRDYVNALNHINQNGILIFHDINSDACPGIKRLWQEVKAGRTSWEFIASNTCGIGVIEI
jgi:predicted O-methyltransferase YrrM